ncbi:MAG: hypothetical protein V1899_02185 [Planctomycetota bacterium]
MFFLLAFASPLFSGEYAPTITKDWVAKDGDKAQSGGRPICMFAYNNEKSIGAAAIFLESTDFLGNDEVQKVLKNFTCIKVDPSQKSDKLPKKWPNDILSRAKTYRLSVLLLSNDFATQFYFKKGANDGNLYEATAKNFLAAANRILQNEAQKKQAADKNPKVKEPPPQEAVPIKVPGLENLDPDKEKDPKKPNGKKPVTTPNTPKDE